MAKPFLCYSMADATEFARVRRYLLENDVAVVDGSEIPPGDVLGDAIRNAIRQADSCVFLLSQNSQASTWCMAEVSVFWHARRRIIILPITPPCTAVPDFLHGIKRANTLEELLEACRTSPTYVPLDPRSVDVLEQSGMNIFRIPDENPRRQQRVRELICEEVERARSHGARPTFRLLASSGFSYVHPNGPVWRDGLGAAVLDSGAHLEVVLESPFSPFALTRALANDVDHHHWDEKVHLQTLKTLCERDGVEVRVTDHAANCSLFFSSQHVLYDPYLWGLPGRARPTENNFFVLEFAKLDGQSGRFDLLARHFDFLARFSVSLADFLRAKPSLAKREQRFRAQLEAMRA